MKYNWNQKNIIGSKINIVGSKKTTRYLDELDKKILELDKYHDHDDYEYKGIRDIKDLFKLSIDKDHYKPTLYIKVVIMVIMFNTKVKEIKY